MRSLASLSRLAAQRGGSNEPHGVGVALGVAAPFATRITNASLDAAVDSTVRDLIGLLTSASSRSESPASPAASLETIRTTPGVRAVAPSLEKRTFLVTDVVPAGDPVTVEGIDPATDREIRDIVLVRGVDLAPTQESIPELTEALAAERGLDLGSTVTLYGAQAAPRRRCASSASSPGTAGSHTVRPDGMDHLDAAQQLFGIDAVTAVDVRCRRRVHGRRRRRPRDPAHDRPVRPGTARRHRQRPRDLDPVQFRTTLLIPRRSRISSSSGPSSSSTRCP